MTSSSCPPRDVDSTPDSPTSRIFKYRVTGSGGISAFSQIFYNFAYRYEGMVNDDETYTLGPRDKKVTMSIGSKETIPIVVMESSYEDSVNEAVAILNRRFNAGLELTA